MPLPSLEDFESTLNRTSMDVLGDSIEYQVVGGAFTPKKAYGEFADAIRDISTGTVISQDITLQMLVDDLQRRPNGSDRVRVSRIGSTIYKPVNVRRSQDGKHWEFEVVTANG